MDDSRIKMLMEFFSQHLDTDVNTAVDIAADLKEAKKGYDDTLVAVPDVVLAGAIRKVDYLLDALAIAVQEAKDMSTCCSVLDMGSTFWDPEFLARLEEAPELRDEILERYDPDDWAWMEDGEEVTAFLAHRDQEREKMAMLRSRADKFPYEEDEDDDE